MSIIIKRCRICKGKLTKIGSLGKIALSDFTTKPEVGKKYPLELVYCSKCTLLQLHHNAPRDLMYKNYWYESRLNKEIVNDLKEISSYIGKKDIHIDIGANDGTLLKLSKAKYKMGVDPSNIKPVKLKGNYGWVTDYWENVLTINATVITAIACLYDLPDPNKFIKNVKHHLLPNGVFISQFQPLERMIELNDVGNICHEHLEYYSYKSLVYLFEQNRLEIFKVERNKMNGGSYRIFSRHYQTGSIKFKEKEYGVKELKDFFKRVEENKKKFLEWLSNDKVNHLDVCGFGASTKANSILQYYGIKNINIVDINPKKKGKYGITQRLPIIDKIPKDCEYLWVFPYGFLDYFKEKEKGYKGKWITTIPEFKII